MGRYAILILALAGAYLGFAAAQDPNPSGPPASAPAPREEARPPSPVGKEASSEKGWIVKGFEEGDVVELEIKVTHYPAFSGPEGPPDLRFGDGRTLRGKEFMIHVAPPAVEQLRRVGIEAPMKFFEGKVVRVRGPLKAVRYLEPRPRDYDAYEVVIVSIDQFVSVKASDDLARPENVRKALDEAIGKTTTVSFLVATIESDRPDGEVRLVPFDPPGWRHGQPASITAVVLASKVRMQFSRIGITDLESYLRGKTVRVNARVAANWLVEGTHYQQRLEVDDLVQFEAIEQH